MSWLEEEELLRQNEFFILRTARVATGRQDFRYPRSDGAHILAGGGQAERDALAAAGNARGNADAA